MISIYRKPNQQKISGTQAQPLAPMGMGAPAHPLHLLCRYFMILPLVVLGCAPLASAAEIDSVTPRHVVLADARGDLNAIFRQRIAAGVERANERGGDIADLEAAEFCNEELLYTELRKAIFQSLTASWGLKGYQLDKDLREQLAPKSYSLSLKDSIYRDISFLEGFSLNLKELSDVVRLDGHLVGLDKLGHMFAEGWHYFAMVNEDGDSLQDALIWGRDQEEGKFGYVTTGIFSYADLVANFHGYRFWNRVLETRRDPLKTFFADWLTDSYVACRIQFIDSLRYRKIVRAWEVEASFDLADYIDGAWDEGNNCNSYADAGIEAKVRGRSAELDPAWHCPLSPQACVEARGRYADLAKYLLHPACLGGEAGSD